MQDKDLKNIQVFCTNATCGDASTNTQGQTFTTKRKMNYVGRAVFRGHVYQCPVCGRKKKAFMNRLSDSYQIVSG